MRMGLCAIVLGALMALAQPLRAADGDVPAEVRQAAVVGLPRFVAYIARSGTDAVSRPQPPPISDNVPSAAFPAGQGNQSPESDFGFRDADELNSATLGDPYLLYVIAPAALRAYRAGDGLDSLITESGMWYFPVLAGIDIRAVLIVDHMAGGWTAVSFGHKDMADGLNALARNWGASTGNNPKLIVVPEVSKYLFTIPEKGSDNLTRLDAAGNGTLEGVADAVSSLIPILEANTGGTIR